MTGVPVSLWGASDGEHEAGRWASTDWIDERGYDRPVNEDGDPWYPMVYAGSDCSLQTIRQMACPRRDTEHGRCGLVIDHPGPHEWTESGAGRSLRMGLGRTVPIHQVMVELGLVPDDINI